MSVVVRVQHQALRFRHEMVECRMMRREGRNKIEMLVSRLQQESAPISRVGKIIWRDNESNNRNEHIGKYFKVKPLNKHLFNIVMMNVTMLKRCTENIVTSFLSNLFSTIGNGVHPFASDCSEGPCGAIIFRGEVKLQLIHHQG